MKSIDILSIHEIIVKNFENSTDSNITELQQLYDEIGTKSTISSEIMNDLQEKINETKRITDSENFFFYLTHALSLLDEFQSLKKKLNKIQFFGIKNDNDENKLKIKTVISRYIELVEQYFPETFSYLWQDAREIIPKKRSIANDVQKMCPNCGSKKDQFVLSENHITCSVCGTVITTTNDNLISFNDIERINIGSKYSYDRRVHFKDSVKRFQGKQNVNIPTELFENMIKHFLNFRLIPSNYSEIPKNIAFQKVTREHVHIFLKELGYSKYYDDIVYIYHKITGHEIPDITHLENQLYIDFDILVEEYDKTFKNDRKNFINNQYVLFQLLRKYNYQCRKEDFNFLKTNDRKSYHDTVCQQLFERLGWNFKAIF
jgi:ribosomal protein S27E